MEEFIIRLSRESEFDAEAIVKEDFYELREMQVTAIGFCNVCSLILLFLIQKQNI